MEFLFLLLLVFCGLILGVDLKVFFCVFELFNLLNICFFCNGFVMKDFKIVLKYFVFFFLGVSCGGRNGLLMKIIRCIVILLFFRKKKFKFILLKRWDRFMNRKIR